jgi:AmmeMemoRadiSam system protein B
MGIRKADFAGSWYPGRSDDCEQEILSFLKDKNISGPAGKHLIGGIVPHAGWYFSGSIACNVISALKDETPPDVVVIFGMHLHEDSPRYIMKEGGWETPFGDIQIADELTGKLIEKFSFNIETAENYQRDNTIELQLPFVKYLFGNVKIVPIGVPPATDSLRIGEAVAEIASELGLKIKVLGSTDLTHYGSDNVINEAKVSQNACCAGAASTAIACANFMGATRAESIAYATSYDKSPGDSFVGYVGIVFG